MENKNIIVFRDKDAIASTRPAKYIEQEIQQVRRQSSVAPTSAAATGRRKSLMDRYKLSADYTENQDNEVKEEV